MDKVSRENLFFEKGFETAKQTRPNTFPKNFRQKINKENL